MPICATKGPTSSTNFLSLHSVWSYSIPDHNTVYLQQKVHRHPKMSLFLQNSWLYKKWKLPLIILCWSCVRSPSQICSPVSYSKSLAGSSKWPTLSWLVDLTYQSGLYVSSWVFLEEPYGIFRLVIIALTVVHFDSNDWSKSEPSQQIENSALTRWSEALCWWSNPPSSLAGTRSTPIKWGTKT